jgi:diguanylate cyclase (GGDEF)-like protein/PAS domain S-box-containing protein
MGFGHATKARQRPSLFGPIAVVCALIALIVVLYIATRLVSTQSYSDLEHREVDVAVGRAETAIRGRIRALGQIAADYAMWNDAYDFAEGRNPSFVEDNLTAESMKNLNVDFMAVVDPLKRELEGRAADTTGGQTPDGLPDYLSAILVSGDLDRQYNPAVAPGGGIMRTAHGPVMFTTQPITNSDGTRRADAFLIAGRLLGADEVHSLSVGVGQPFDVYATGVDSHLPAGVSEDIATETSGTVVVRTLSATQVAGFREFADYTGRPAFVTGVTLPRAAYQSGVHAQTWFGYALIVFGVTSILIVGWAMLRQQAEVRERVRAEAQASTSEQRYREFIDHMTDAVFGLDLDGRITFANRCAAKLTGFTIEELAGQPYTRVLSDAARARADRRYKRTLERGAPESFEVELASAQGLLVPVEISSSPMIRPDGSVQGVQWIARDVTERKRFETDLIRLANRDHLTGLYNRRHFEEMLENQLKHSSRAHTSGAVLWFDLDAFKDINDSLGHVAGDEVLAGLGNALEHRMRADGMIARIGGDEFAILLSGATEDESRACAARVMRDIGDWSTQIEEQDVRVTASMGVVLFPDHAETAQEIFTRADLAMYRAKASGGNQFCVYRPDEDWGAELQTRLNWTALIDTALTEDDFLIYSQPVLNLADGSVDRHELLIRMQASDGTLILPGEFLPVADRTGQIADIDRWMIRQAIRLISKESDAGEPCRFDINLSGRALSDPEILSVIEDELDSTRVDPSLFGVEITETEAVADMAKARSFIESLRRLGCRVALDDFGCGFASLYYLRNLPIDCLKIDGSFVKNICTSPEDQHVVRAIVELCSGFGIESTAECVEDEETLDLLREYGVTYAQGFYIARPKPLQEAARDAHLST